jgi:hypothetical protein
MGSNSKSGDRRGCQIQTTRQQGRISVTNTFDLPRNAKSMASLCSEYDRVRGVWNNGCSNIAATSEILMERKTACEYARIRLEEFLHWLLLSLSEEVQSDNSINNALLYFNTWFAIRGGWAYCQ